MLGWKWLSCEEHCSMVNKTAADGLLLGKVSEEVLKICQKKKKVPDWEAEVLEEGVASSTAP